MRISGHALFWGLLLIILGALLLLSNLGIITQSIWDYWPVIFIIIGLKIIIHAYGRSTHEHLDEL
jgi:uncharacterized membrane protein